MPILEKAGQALAGIQSLAVAECERTFKCELRLDQASGTAETEEQIGPVPNSWSSRGRSQTCPYLKLGTYPKQVDRFEIAKNPVIMKYDGGCGQN
ncbi:MAG TPA: hypothetical protein VGD99_09250 [Anaerolineae bacterium]|jgi:hypothetical protein